jgi:hypothetical protein
MSAAYSVTRRDSLGTSYQVYVHMVCDTSYPSGGYPVAGSDVGLGTITGMKMIATNTAAILYQAQLDQEAGKVVVETGGAEASGDVHTLEFDLEFTGI